MMSDLAIEALHVALNGLSQRQRVIADNVANLETPHFLAGKVDFESSLHAALATGRGPDSTVVTTTRSLEPTRENGNNVKPDDEVVSNIDTNLRYELAVNAVTAKFKMLRTAISGNP